MQQHHYHCHSSPLPRRRRREMCPKSVRECPGHAQKRHCYNTSRDVVYRVPYKREHTKTDGSFGFITLFCFSFSPPLLQSFISFSFYLSLSLSLPRPTIKQVRTRPRNTLSQQRRCHRSCRRAADDGSLDLEKRHHHHRCRRLRLRRPS